MSAPLDPEAAYYQGVEEAFVSLRGDPLFLSNADWLLIRKWRLAGLPLRVVLRGIRDAFDARAHSWSRNRRVGSLAYCAAEVEAAGARWQRALGAGSPTDAAAEAFLARLAEALEGAPGMAPPAAEIAQRTAREIRDRARPPILARELEPWLAERESELLAALRRQAGPDLEALEAELESELGSYREKLPARVFAQLRAGSLARRLLERHGLPRLSLFHL